MDLVVFAVFCILLGVVVKTSVAATAAAVLLVGGIGFWILLVLSSIIILACLDHENDLGAFLSVVGTLAVLQLFSGVDLVSYVQSNPLALLWGGGLYFILGTLWSFFKWWVHVKDARKVYDHERDDFLGHGGDMTPEEKARWKGLAPRIPEAIKNKSRIMGWMTFWPWSALWFVINDPIRRAFKAIYERLQGAYQRIVDKAFAGTEKDFS